MPTANETRDGKPETVREVLASHSALFTLLPMDEILSVLASAGISTADLDRLAAGTHAVIPLATLRAIAEGYDLTVSDDRFIKVANPRFQEDDGSSPYLVIDTVIGAASEGHSRAAAKEPEATP